METRREISDISSVHQVRQILYGAVGWKYGSPGIIPDILSDLRKWRMVETKSGGFSFAGTLTGIGANGQAFRIADVTAEEVPGRDPGFQGAIISFRQAQSFTGRTIIVEDKGVYNPTTIDLMMRVPVHSERFENIFEVYSDSPATSADLVTSGFIEKMTDFSRETLGRKLQSCLIENEVHFALDIDGSFSFSKAPDLGSETKIKRDIIIEAGSICVLLEKLYSIQASLGRADSVNDRKVRLTYYKKCLSKMMAHAKTLEVSAMVQAA